MRTVINPQGMDQLEWFDRTTQLFDDIFPPFTLQDPDDWQTWAAAARRVQSAVPDPYQYEDWRLWSERFNLVMGAQ